jgi:polyisoprenoid-binding protein YceI
MAAGLAMPSNKLKMNYQISCALIAIAVLASCAQKKATPSATFKVDEKRSSIEWKGSAPTHAHTGGFKVSGTLQTDATGKISGGDFTIPISSISNFDLKEDGPRMQLLNHLKSADFFNIAVFPDAKFHITKVDMQDNASSSATITGDFTLIGKTISMQLPAVIEMGTDEISAQSTFKLNRLKWGMNSFNDPEQNMYILPDIDISLKLFFTRTN